MLFLLAPWLVAALPSLIGAAGGFGQSLISGGDIRRQNRYNDPANQVARLREAGLPMAAMLGGQAGNQSALPDRTGIKDAGHSLGSYINTQTQLKQLKILDEEIKLKQAESALKGAETKWLLSGKGIDIDGTNLTQGLMQKQGIEANTLRSGQLANSIAQKVEANTSARIGLENTRLMQEIKNMIKTNEETGERIKGIELDNVSKNIVNSFKADMTRAELDNLLKRNGILATQGEIDKIHLEIEKATKSNKITLSDMQTLMAELSYDKIGQEFKNYNQYYEFVNRVQDGFNNKNRPGGIKGIGYDIQTLINYAYLATVGSGMGRAASPNVGSIMQGMKGAPNQYRNYHIYNND